MTQARSQGTVLIDIDLVISNKAQDMIKGNSRNIIVSRDIPIDPEVSGLITEYKDLVSTLAN